MSPISPQILIREAKPEDYEAVRLIWEATGLPIRPTGRDTREAWTQQLAQFPHTYLVATVDGAIVGLVLGTHDGRKGWINRLAVHPGFQRRGIAHSLLAACEKALADEGIEIFAAFVEKGNTGSAACFESAGYVNDVPVEYFRKRLRDDI